MEIQIRHQSGELRYFNSLHEALVFAMSNPSVWKVSFNAEDGTRIRMVRTTTGWTYESLDGARYN